MPGTCVMCNQTTEDLTGWYLIQVSTAEYVGPNGVIDPTLNTYHTCSLLHRDNWLRRAGIDEAPPAAGGQP